MISDGCGSTLNCGSICPTNQTCGGGGTPNVCGCTPTTCMAQGKNCGSISNGCGGTLNCGMCGAPNTCGGGGTANVCGCTPMGCGTKNCGTISDGCGGTPSCGTCMLPQTCGGSGTANVCGCTPTTCAAQGKNCGAIADGCGSTLVCGACVSPDTCGGGGIANVCGCTPALVPDPSGTAAAWASFGPKPMIAQTFVFEKGLGSVDAIQLRGQYPAQSATDTITVGIYPTYKGGPDGANPLWEDTLPLEKTNFYQVGIIATKQTTINTWTLPRGVRLDPGVTYWVVASTTGNVTLGAYDGSAAGGDAIRPGDEMTWSPITGAWSVVARNDLFLVINPCSGGDIGPPIQ
jgi:hypothetical protein